LGYLEIVDMGSTSKIKFEVDLKKGGFKTKIASSSSYKLLFYIILNLNYFLFFLP